MDLRNILHQNEELFSSKSSSFFSSTRLCDIESLIDKFNTFKNNSSISSTTSLNFIKNVPYRSLSHFGFNVPIFNAPSHYHIPIYSNKFTPLKKYLSLFHLFSNDRNSDFHKFKYDFYSTFYCKEKIPKQINISDEDNNSDNNSNSTDSNTLVDEEENDNFSFYKNYENNLYEDNISATLSNNILSNNVKLTNDFMKNNLNTIVEETEIDNSDSNLKYDCNNTFILDIIENIIDKILDNFENTFIKTITKMSYSLESLDLDFIENFFESPISSDFSNLNSSDSTAQYDFSESNNLNKSSSILNKISLDNSTDYIKIWNDIPYIDFNDENEKCFEEQNSNNANFQLNEIDRLVLHKIDINDLKSEGRIYNTIEETILSKLNSPLKKFEKCEYDENKEFHNEIISNSSTPRSKIPILQKTPLKNSSENNSDKILISNTPEFTPKKNIPKKVHDNTTTRKTKRNFIQENINRVSTTPNKKTQRINHGAIFSLNPFSDKINTNSVKNDFHNIQTTPKSLTSFENKCSRSGAVKLWMSVPNENKCPINYPYESNSYTELYQRNPDKPQNKLLYRNRNIKDSNVDFNKIEETISRCCESVNRISCKHTNIKIDMEEIVNIHKEITQHRAYVVADLNEQRNRIEMLNCSLNSDED